VLAAEPCVALNAGRHGGVPASFHVASRFYPLFYVVDTHHPRAGGRPRTGPGNQDRAPCPAEPPGPPNPNSRPEGHIPSCRGGERVLPLDGPSVPAPASGWWVSAPSHSLPGRSRDGSIPFGMRRGPPRAHSPPGPSRLDPGGFRPVAALGGTVRTVFCRYLVSVMGAMGSSESYCNFRISSEVFGYHLVHRESSLHPDRTLGSYGTERPDYPAPLPHHRGTPARRAIIPSMRIPRLDPEAGLARGCGEEEERIKNHPVNIRYCQVPGEPLAPRRGIPSGRGPPDYLLAAGLGSRRLTLHPPFPLRNCGRSAVSPAPRREAAPFRRLTPFRRNGAGHPPAATLSSGIPLG
jgi:hypothetical protein